MAVKKIFMPNEAEFQGYYVLTHAWADDLVCKMELELPERVFMDPKLQLALELRSLMSRTNETTVRDRPSVDGSLNHYAQVFKLLEKPTTPYLFACCLHLEFLDIRKGALKAMQRAYYIFEDDKESGFLLDDFVNILAFDDEEEAIGFLNYYEISVDNINGRMRAQIGKTRVKDASGNHKVVSGSFVEGKRVSLIPKKSFRLIEKKREGLSDVEIIQGISPSGLVPSKITAFQNDPPMPLVPLDRSQSKTSLQLPLIAFSEPQTQHLQQPQFQSSKPLPQYSQPQQQPQSVFRFDTPTQPILPALRPTQPIMSQKIFELPSASQLQKTFIAATLTTAPIHNARPIADHQKNAFTDLTLNGIFDWLLDIEIHEQISDAIRRSMMVEKHGYSIACEMYIEILSTLTEEVIGESLSSIRDVFQLRFALTDLATECVNSAISSMLKEIALAELKTHRAEKRIQRFVRDRWKFFAYYRRITREGNQRDNARSFDRLRTAIALNSSPPNIYPNEFNQSISTSAFEPAMVNLANQQWKANEIWRTPINISSILAPAMRRKSGHSQPRCKFLLGFGYHRENELASTMSKNWLLSQLSQSSCVGNTICNERFLYEKLNMSILISIWDPTRLCNRPQHNSTCPNSGLNASILQLDYFDEHLNSDAYWATQAQLLSNFSKSLPRYARTPLLVICWPNQFISNAAYESKIQDMLDSVNNGCAIPFTYISILFISTSGGMVDFTSARSMLCEELITLTSEAATEPYLAQNLTAALKESDLASHYMFFIQKVDSLVSNRICNHELT